MNMEESNNGSKKLQIRNSTAEFLIFQIENKEEGIEVLYQDETLWLTQKTMSILFDVDIRTINEHLKNIYSQGEVDKNTTIRKNRIVQKEGNRNISREVFIYSLEFSIRMIGITYLAAFILFHRRVSSVGSGILFIISSPICQSLPPGNLHWRSPVCQSSQRPISRCGNHLVQSPNCPL